MTQPLISIIIPVYNVEKYLHQCLDSVIAQTYTNWECLLIDDGSKDSSGAICDEYAEKDSRFKVFHKENGGVSSARNIGLKHLNGDYTCFFDSDDIVPQDALAYLESLMSDDIDSVMAAFQFIDEYGTMGDIIKPDGFQILSHEDSLFSTYGIGTAWQGYLWNRLFRTSIIKCHEMFFDTDLCYKEDGVFLVQYLCFSKKEVPYGEKTIYLYRQTETSAMGKFREVFDHKMISNIEAHLKIYEILKKNRYSRKLLNVSIENIYFCTLKIRNKYKKDIKRISYDKEISILLKKYIGFKYHILFFLVKLKYKIRENLVRFKNSI